MVKFHYLTPDSENHCDLVIIYLFVYKKDQLGRSACCSPETDLPKQKKQQQKKPKTLLRSFFLDKRTCHHHFCCQNSQKILIPAALPWFGIVWNVLFFPMCKNSGYFLHGIFKIWHLKKVSLPFLPFSLQSESSLCLSSQNQIHQKDQHPK